MSEIDYASFNKTELTYLIRNILGVVVRRSVSKDRLVEMIKTGEYPKPEEISPTTESRKKLQVFLENNWSSLNSQLPCKGENRGKCTIYPCPEGRHLDCYLSAEPHMKVHAIT
jgi:hypothetical protein